MTGSEIDEADRLQRFRLRSMWAVEDMIAAVVQALAETGRLEQTYVVFTSDNGVLMGQHRAVGRKANPYEEATGIPLIVRGPGVPVGRTDAFALNIDLAPTLLELAGAPIPESLDGRSLVPFLRGAPRLLATGGAHRELRTAPRTPAQAATRCTSTRTPRSSSCTTCRRTRTSSRTSTGRPTPRSRSARKRMATLSACRGVACRS